MPTALFNLRPSQNLIKIIFIIYSLIIVEFIFSNISQSILTLLLTVFVLSCLLSFYIILHQQEYWKKLIWDQKLSWNIYTKSAHIYNINILPNTFCSRYLMVLNFSVLIKEKDKIKKKSLVILPDSMIKQDFKRLRMYLLNQAK